MVPTITALKPVPKAMEDILTELRKIETITIPVMKRACGFATEAAEDDSVTLTQQNLTEIVTRAHDLTNVAEKIRRLAPIIEKTL